MSEKKRVLLLILIMAIACTVSTVVAIVLLYRTALEGQREVLIGIARDHVQLIEELAVTNAGQTLSPGGDAEADLLKKIASAHKRFEGIGLTGEFKLAKRAGDNIVYLLDHRNKRVENVPVPMNSNLAEPMRLALSGYSGSMVGTDYRGVKVLAAYEPVPGLHWGIVAKVDLDELRAPFVRASLLAMTIGTITVLLGALIFIRITSPIITRLRKSSQHLAKLVTSLQQSEESLLKARNELETRVEERTANLVKAKEQLEVEVHVRARAEERLQALWTIAKKVNAEVEELCDHVLQYTLEMTRSRYAFYGFLNADESLMTIYSWSKEALEDCRMAAKPIEHSVERAGIWAEAIRQRRVIVVNDYLESNPGKQGTPDGHVQITRLLAVPVFIHNRIVSVVVAANKDSNYDDDDVKQLEAFASGVQLIIDQRKMEEALRSSDMECRLLSRQVIDAQEKERKRLASEFHDGIGQSLAAIKYRAEGYIRRSGDITPESTRDLKGLIQMIRDAMDEVRKIQNDLHPAYLDMIGLTETMADFCEKFQATYTGIQSILQVDISEQDLPDTLKVPIFRIFQEAMNNAAKHSRADRILINVRREADRFELAIQDNGTGFSLENGLPANGQGKGLGLFSMRERAGLSGGSLEFKTAPGEGTAIIASWPLVTTLSE